MMKDKRRDLELMVFVPVNFIALLMSLLICNEMGEFEMSPGVLLITAFGMTVIMTMEYLLLRKIKKVLPKRK